MRNLITWGPVQVYATPDTRFAPIWTLQRGTQIVDRQPAAPNEPPAGWFEITYFHPTTGAPTVGYIQDIAETYGTAMPAPLAPAPRPLTFWERHGTGIMLGAGSALVVVLIIVSLVRIFG